MNKQKQTPAEFLLQKLEESEIYQACPPEVKEAVYCLVKNLSSYWADWNGEYEFDFCETLLLEVFCLPEDLPEDLDYED